MTSAAPGAAARMVSRICLRRLLASGGNDAKYARTFSTSFLASFLDDEGDFISLARVDPHVVDQHRRREDRVRPRISVEMSPNGEIEHQEERLIEYRSAIVFQCVTRDPVVGCTVDEESDGKRIPFDGKSVEVVREHAARESIRVGK